MLTRAAQRRQLLIQCQHVSEQLQLPSLCSRRTFTYTIHKRSKPRASSPRAAARKIQASANLSTDSRKLASLAESSASSLLSHESPYTSYSQPPAPSSTAGLNHEGPSDLSNPTDPTDLLLLDFTTAVGPHRVESKKPVQVRGNVDEIETNLDACLFSQAWDRAFLILDQLRDMCRDAARRATSTELADQFEAEIQRFYNKVFEAMVYDHVWNGKSTNIGRINTWIEDLKEAAVEPDARTFALKIKAALNTLTGNRRIQTVRRYWEMAKRYDLDIEVASLKSILSDTDLGKLSEISPAELAEEDTFPSTMELMDQVEDTNADADSISDGINIREDLTAQSQLPEASEVSQKGMGMVSLRESLSLFTENKHLSQYHDFPSMDDPARAQYEHDRQLQLERDGLNSAVERWRVEREKMQKMGINSELERGKIGSLMWDWHTKLQASIERVLKTIKEAELTKVKDDETKRLVECGPFLQLLDTPALAAVTILSLMKKVMAEKTSLLSGARLADLVTAAGRNLEAEFESKLSAQQERRSKAALLASRKAKMGNDDSAIAADGVEEAEKDIDKRLAWGRLTHAKVGSVLIDLLTSVAKFETKKVSSDSDGSAVIIEELAFQRRYTYLGGRSIAMLCPHPDFVTMLAQQPVTALIAKQLPMVCKPMPWTGFKYGGYLESRIEVLRNKDDKVQRAYTRAAADRGDLAQLLRGLDVLGSTAWRINADVLRVMLQAWNTGEKVANLAELNLKPDMPAQPGPNATAFEKHKYFAKLREIENEKTGLHSKRCFQNFQLEIARAYVGEAFYLPHNVDFRGRAYPIPPYLNQMGADNARGLLLFDKGRPLGEAGFRWLKIHLSNLHGYDKASLSDRVKYVDDHIEDIRDTVADPLGGKRWWLQAEDAWQCLGACFELIHAIDTGDPYSFVSHFPVHQDGSCNGLQHYAALGGDIAGARQVNLEPGDKPADVYTGVMELVAADIHLDAEAGDELAKLIDGRIVRKIVKQTVMTNVYGVTFLGATAQVRKQLDTFMPDLAEKGLTTSAAVYIAKKIFKGLGALFNGAHNIQYWFGDCASRITSCISPTQIRQFIENERPLDPTQLEKLTQREREKRGRRHIDVSDFRSTIVWTTPLKLPVVQPYRDNIAKTVRVNATNISITEPAVTDSVSRRRQLQAFPPNFIHSLDASHMLLSAMAADEAGLTFAAVHDSFWTHASDVDELSRLLRDAFVRMHSENIVARLKAEFDTRYKDHIYLAKLDPHCTAARKVLEWRVQNKFTQSKGARKAWNSTIDLKRSTTKSARAARDKSLQAYYSSPTSVTKQQYHELLCEYERAERYKSGEGETETPASIFDEFGSEDDIVAKSSFGETATNASGENDSKMSVKAVEEASTQTHSDEDNDVDMVDSLAGFDEEEDEEEKKRRKLEEEEEQLEEESRAERGEKMKGIKKQAVWVWLPMKFKEIPKKGDWDVSRTRESIYFFS